MDTKTKLVTYDDYRNLPDDGKRYEIIGGELLMTPAPDMDHQNIAGNIYYSIRQFLEKSKVGKVFVSSADVVLSMTDVVQPDLVFVTTERAHIIAKKNIVAAPDLVVENLSEHTEAIDRNRKKRLYENYGVKEYWIVDPEEKQIEQHILENKTFQLNGKFDKSEKLTSTVIKGFSLQLKDVFTS